MYKVITGSAYPNESLKNPNNVEILDKKEMFGRTKVLLYSSESYEDAECFVKFLKTNFAKAIVQMTPLKLFYYLPDFDDLKMGIDWSQSISDIDDQLFQKYNLTIEEIDYIQCAIKGM